MKAVGKEVTIIMVEDDEGHARLIEKNVRRAGEHNDIIPFTNGTEALDYVLGKDRSGKVSEDRYLLILLDLNLGDTRGLAGLQLLRKLYPGLPVFVVSGTHDPRVREGILLAINGVAAGLRNSG